MFDVLGSAGLLVFALASATIGARLLWLGRRTHGVPELALGTGFVVGCVFGYVPETLVNATGSITPEHEAAVVAVSQVAMRVAVLSVLVFTREVFRPREGWALVFACAVAAALVMSYLAFPFNRPRVDTGRELFWYDFFVVARTVAIAWSAIEAFRYHARLRRRLRLGLSDAVTTHRFRLWGIGMAAMAVFASASLWADVLRIDGAALGWIALESSMGIVGAAALWLTFFPSRRYIARVERRTPQPRPD